MSSTLNSLKRKSAFTFNAYLDQPTIPIIITKRSNNKMIVLGFGLTLRFKYDKTIGEITKITMKILNPLTIRVDKVKKNNDDFHEFCKIVGAVDKPLHVDNLECWIKKVTVSISNTYSFK